MNIHEYQAKELLKKHGVKCGAGYVAETPEQAVEVAKKLQEETGTKLWVIKAQVHAGGRGKAGGVKIAKTLDEVREKAGQIIGMTLITPQTGKEGIKVNKVLVANDLYYEGEHKPKEYYLAILLDRSKQCNVIMASAEGGVDIEEVAHKTPEKIIKEWVDNRVGLQPFQARKIGYALGLEGTAHNDFVKFLFGLYKTYLNTDATLLEVNPMLRTSDNQIVAVDCKINIDDNALFRQKEIAAMRDITQEDPMDVEASENGLNYVKLNGNVGCMVNGAGLAMATMDMIKLSGGEPANFLDVGGGANAQTVEAGFRLILKDPNVKAILVNVFGGIVRCDRVANGIVEAYKKIGDIRVPIIVRLQGTNAEEAAKIIDNSGLKVQSAILLKDAAEKVKAAVS
ncbi:MAG: ADP-forming succinate--CoA ligase subunit beta [Cytophagales bacterium]|nr:ADP-forming succinate--CoA ligase subunit beta [Cytophagales bacterium]MDW8383891.1 ADP-forming succinate--CoA ligase subunit beta [Flammeovirgaceae bacterium]